jgi:signal transduction histidine kinase
MIPIELFQPIMNGMMIAMFLYSLGNYYITQNKTFLIYALTLTASFYSFYIGDRAVENNISDINSFTFQPEIDGISCLLYFYFSVHIFRNYVTSPYLYKLYKTNALSTAIATIASVIFKLYHFYFFANVSYLIVAIFGTIIQSYIYYILFQQNLLFIKYYLIGSIVLFISWTLMHFLNTYPDLLTLVFDKNNAFSFPNSYGKTGIICESIFMFIGMSELNKLTENEKINLKKKVLSIIEEKNQKEKRLIETRKNIMYNLKKQINQYIISLKKYTEFASYHIEQNKNEDAHVYIKHIEQTTCQSLATIRSIIKDLKDQQVVEGYPIEQQLSLWAVQALSLTSEIIELEVTPSDKWKGKEIVLYNIFLPLYLSALELIMLHKQPSKIFASFLISQNTNLHVIIQDDSVQATSHRILNKKLNELSDFTSKAGGILQYLVEPDTETIIRFNFPNFFAIEEEVL